MKKLLSVLLVVSMMLATGSFSVAADTATVETNTGVTLSLFDGVLYKSNGTVNSATLASAGNFYPNPEYKVITTQYTLRSAGLGTGVSSVTEGDNAYYSVNWSDIQNQTKFNLNEYMTNNPVVSVSYDVRIPEADSDKWRQTEIRFSSDGANTNNLALVCVKYDDNRFFIDEDTTSGIDCVNSKTKAYTPGSWVTVETRVYRNTDNKIDVGVYVGEEQIYYGEGTGDYTDNLALRQINFKTETTASGDASVTYTTNYDDIDVSVLVAEYIPEPMIRLILSETSSGVECKANISTGENFCLVAAVFDGNNKLQKLWTDTTLDNNALSIPISDEQYLKTGYEIKAFLFDSLQSAIPQVESKSITLTSK